MTKWFYALDSIDYTRPQQIFKYPSVEMRDMLLVNN
jgi:hypothetical protein